MSCNYHLCLVPERFHHPKGNPVPSGGHSTPPLPQPLATTNLLSVSVDFWTFHINGIMQHVAFRVWRLSLSLMSSSFFHVVA